MSPKKTPPSVRGRNKRPNSNGDDKEDSIQESSKDQYIREDRVSSDRDRSLSKRRRTSEQQHKITNYTSGQSGADRSTQGDTSEILRTRSDKEVMAALSRLEQGMEDGKKQTEKLHIQLEKVVSELFEIRKENMYLRKKNESLERKCSDLSDDVERLEKRIKQEKELRNVLEQYTRKDNIKIIHLPGDVQKETAEETERKVLGFIQKTLNVTAFQPSHISVAHRVGKFSAGQSRPVIVRLTTQKIKSEIFRQRKKLKQEKSTIFINEDLTKLNSQRLYEIKRHPAVLSAWSFQGKLYCKLLNLRIINIEEGDMEKIDRVLQESPDPGPLHRFRRSLSPSVQQQLRGRHPVREGRGGGRGGGGGFGNQETLQSSQQSTAVYSQCSPSQSSQRATLVDCDMESAELDQ